MTEVVITGIRGFIGARLAQAFRDRGDHVRGIDLAGGPDVTVADIGSPGPWRETLRGADLVIHTAALVDESAPRDRAWRVNVEGTRHVLEAAADADVGRAVHLSSIVVHGERFRNGVDESGPVRMTGNIYTDTKVAAEHQALRIAATGRLPVTVVRPGDVYGPGSRQWTIRPLEILQGPFGALPDGGRGILTPTYVDDLVEGVVAAATHPAAVGEVLHVTGGEGVTVERFFAYYAEALGVSLRSVPAPVARGAIRVAGAVGRRFGVAPPLGPEAVEYLTHPGTYSIERAERLLGWRPRVDLEEGMRRTLSWARAEGLLPRTATGEA